MKEMFYAGKYEDIRQSRSKSLQNLKYKVGAFVFLGYSQEAKTLLETTQWKRNDYAESHFYYLLHLIRQGNLADIKEHYVTLFYKCRRISNRNSSSSYFLYQGLGLIYFYLGEFDKASIWANRAYEYAIYKKMDQYFHMLSTDLLGHSLCMIECYSRGVRFLDMSAKYAKKIKNNNNLDVIDLAKMIYNVEAGHRLDKQEVILDNWLQNIRTQDNYTRNNALLCRVKLLLHKGQFGRAQGLLYDLGRNVFAVNHKRQVLSFNLRSAEIFFYLEQYNAALNLIQSSLKECDQDRDYHFMYRFKKLEIMTLEKSHLGQVSSEQKDELNFYRRRSGYYGYKLGANDVTPDSHYSDDSSLKKYGREVVDHLKSDNFLGALFYNDLIEKENHIDFSLGKRSALITFNHNISYVTGLGPMQFTLLSTLVKRELWTRKELFEEVWGVSYDSFIHDNKLYVSLKRLEGKIKERIFYLDDGKVRVYSFKVRSSLTGQGQDLVSVKEGLGQLHWRQYQVLKDLSVGAIILPKDYSHLVQVSRNTASRDLIKLTSLGFLTRKGEKRGTYYVVRRRIGNEE